MKSIRFALLAIACTLAAASSAQAAQDFGRTFTPVIEDMPTRGVFAIATSDGSHAAPTSGVITQFRHQSTATPAASIQLMTVRNTGGNYAIVGLSAPQQLLASVLGSWPTRIPVQAGDLIGLVGPSNAIAALNITGNAGDIFYAITGVEPALGATFARNDNHDYPAYALDIAATIEPDADGDGFGDETQDGCPAKASTQGRCDARGPALTIKPTPIRRGAKSISFTVRSNEAASVRVYGEFRSGRSKFKIKSGTRTLRAGRKTTIRVKLPSKAASQLRRGKALKGHIKLSATDAAGNRSSYRRTRTVRPK